MYDLLALIFDELRADRAVALATVIGRRGSLPMAYDAKMLVRSDGSTSGTVGGGCLEAEVHAAATEAMASGRMTVDEFHLNEVEEGSGGHVCGGTVRVLTRAFAPRADTIDFFRRAVAARDQPGLYFASRAEGAAAHALVGPAGIIASLGADGDVPHRVPARRWTLGADGWFLERVAPRPLLLVCGAGHCGLAIGAAAAAADYRVWMLEDRPTFLQQETMPWAERLLEVDFESLPELPLEAGTSLVIVTRGHDHDLAVLRQVLDARVDYLGMIGSRRKRELFRNLLASEGRHPAAFERLRSPMGLDIGAQTPAEIAVSVVAELIETRRRRAGAAASTSRPSPAVRADG